MPDLPRACATLPSPMPPPTPLLSQAATSTRVPRWACTTTSRRPSTRVGIWAGWGLAVGWTAKMHQAVQRASSDGGMLLPASQPCPPLDSFLATLPCHTFPRRPVPAGVGGRGRAAAAAAQGHVCQRAAQGQGGQGAGGVGFGGQNILVANGPGGTAIGWLLTASHGLAMPLPLLHVHLHACASSPTIR